MEILCGFRCSVYNFILLFHILLCLTIVTVLYTERRVLHLLVSVIMSEHVSFWDLSSEILLPVNFNKAVTLLL